MSKLSGELNKLKLAGEDAPKMFSFKLTDADEELVKSLMFPTKEEKVEDKDEK